MKNSIQSKFAIKDILLWAAIVVVTLLIFFSINYFKFSTPVTSIILILWVLVGGILAYFTSKGQMIFAFAKEAKVELEKVVWPTRQETVQTTSIVMIMVAVTGFILWGIDSGMMWVIAKITHLG